MVPPSGQPAFAFLDGLHLDGLQNRAQDQAHPQSPPQLVQPTRASPSDLSEVFWLLFGIHHILIILLYVYILYA